MQRREMYLRVLTPRAAAQGREGKVVQVYRKKWVIHVERITREKVNGKHPPLPAPSSLPCLSLLAAPT